MSASAVRGGQVYVEIGGNPSKLLSALSTVNTKVADVGATMESVGMGMAAVGAAIAGPILAVGGAFVENTIEMQNMRAALGDIGRAVAEAVAPAFIGAANIITDASKAVAKFIRENQGLVRLAVLVGGYYFAWGTAIWAVGYAMTSLSKTMASSAALISGFIDAIKGGTVAVVAFATSGPVLAAAAVLAGLAGGAVLAGVNFRKLAGIIGGAFGQPIANLKALFNDLKGTADTTVEGIYRAIAAGDLRAAVDVLWLGWHAAWVRGEQAIMGSLNPFIEDVQNSMSELGVNIAIAWDQGWASLAQSTWGSYIIASIDNIMNYMEYQIDHGVTFYKYAWAGALKFVGMKTKEQFAQERDQLLNAFNARAQQREKDRPGFAGRAGLTDEQKAAIQAEADARQAVMIDQRDKRQKELADRTQADLKRRAAAVADANQKLLDRVNGLPEVKRFEGGGGFKRRTESIGTFSAFGLGQLGTGNIDKQTLDEIKRTNKLLEKLVAGGVVP